MEPLSAFAAAGNVLQFVQVGIGIVDKTVQLVGNGGDLQIQTIKDLTQQLLVSNDHLRQILQPNEAHNSRPGPESALRHANQACLTVSQNFLEFLSSVTGTRPMNTRRAIVLSFKHLRIRERLNDYHQQLDNARSNLMLSLLLYHTHSLSHPVNPWPSHTPAQNSLSDLVEQLPIRSWSLGKDVSRLADQLTGMQITDLDAHAQYRDLFSKHCHELKAIFDAPISLLKPLQQSITKLQDQLQAMSKTLDSEVEANMRILYSLRFPEMFDRREAIVSAHGGTFSWMLEDNSMTDIVWDNFLQWLMSKSANSIFWVQGKPGAGKSTLMRWIDANVDERVKHQLSDPPPLSDRSWPGPENLVVLSYYFWYAGAKFQRSVQGFLQSLLFQMFEADTSLIRTCVPTKLWQKAQVDVGWSAISWKEQELVDIFTDALSRIKTSANVLMVIDGLDESDGTDDQRAHMVAIIEKWLEASHVKACLSSRPWNIYSDLFENVPQLRLQDLTRADIETFARDKFQSDPLFSRHQKAQAMVAVSIIQEIVAKSDGVFLWVRLVVNHLLKYLRDGAQLSDLITELRIMPDDLEEFFTRMMNLIDQRYRPDSARLIQVMLAFTDADTTGTRQSQNNVNEINVPTLSLHDLLNLHERDAGSFRFDPGRQELLRSFQENHCAQDIVYDMLVRRVNSRSMGLLEVFTQDNRLTRLHHGLNIRHKSADKFFDTKVTFIHRTVRDFLLTDAAQSLVNRFMDKTPFSASIYCCNALAARTFAFVTMGDLSGGSVLGKLICHFRKDLEHEQQLFCLFERIVSTQPMPLHDRAILQVFFPDERSIGTNLYPFLVAYNHGWDRYITCRMGEDDVSPTLKGQFLGYILTHLSSVSRGYIMQIVKNVLEIRDRACTRVIATSCLRSYLSSLRKRRLSYEKGTSDIMHLLFEKGAQRDYSREELTEWGVLEQPGDNAAPVTSMHDIIDALSKMRDCDDAVVFPAKFLGILRKRLGRDTKKRRDDSPATGDFEPIQVKRKSVKDDAEFNTSIKRQRLSFKKSDRVYIDLTDD